MSPKRFESREEQQYQTSGFAYVSRSVVTTIEGEVGEKFYLSNEDIRNLPGFADFNPEKDEKISDRQLLSTAVVAILGGNKDIDISSVKTRQGREVLLTFYQGTKISKMILAVQYSSYVKEYKQKLNLGR